MSLVMHSGYLDDAASQKQAQITSRRCVKALRPHADKFDAIACQGCSGLMIAPIVAYLLKKQLVVVRKPDYKLDSHANEQVEGLPHSPVRYLVLDDFYSSGHTLRQIIYTIYCNNSACKFVGRYSYKWDTLEFDGPEVAPFFDMQSWMSKHIARELENKNYKLKRMYRELSVPERREILETVDNF